MASGLLLGIRLGFHHHAPEQAAVLLAFHQQATDEVGGDQLGGAGEEGVRERWRLLGGCGGYGSGLAATLTGIARLSQSRSSLVYRLRKSLVVFYMKALKAAVAALAVICVASTESAYAQNAAIKEMQDNVLRNTGLTRKEGMLFYKVQMQCKQRGFPNHNIWNTCMQAVYVNNDLPMPSSLMGAATFAATQRCISFKSDMEALMCAQGGN